MSTIKFTESGLALAAFKMAVQNNAMLKMVLMNQEAILSRFMANPSMSNIIDKYRLEELDKNSIDYEHVNNMLKLRDLLENLSKQEAWEFAVENDPDFDIDMVKE